MEAELRARLRHAGQPCRYIRDSRLGGGVADKGLALGGWRRTNPCQLALYAARHHPDEQETEGHSLRCGGTSFACADRDVGTTARSPNYPRYRGGANVFVDPGSALSPGTLILRGSQSPLYPRKQTCSASKSMSALCQQRKSPKLFGLGPWLGRLIAPIWEAGLASGLYDAASTGFSGDA